jgi:cation diffusion facilitator CzcD-associated flavoprotein CzcO
MGDDANRQPRVAMVGGGFAGPSAVRALDGADVDRTRPELEEAARWRQRTS